MHVGLLQGIVGDEERDDLGVAGEGDRVVQKGEDPIVRGVANKEEGEVRV